MIPMADKSSKSFDDLADIYEAMVDWPKRLAREEPFYRRLFDSLDARVVLDAACGTGHHAAMFHAWGLEVEGADISPQMIDRARARSGEPAGLRWTVRAFDEPAGPADTFDVAVCVGNSLALAPDELTVGRAIARLLSVVRSGGAIVLHVLNLWRLADGPCLWQKCQRVRLPRGDTLILKGVHRCASRGYVDLVVTQLDGEPVMHERSVPLLGLEPEQLVQMARAAGAHRVESFGGYDGQPYQRTSSTDLLLVAHK